jgi:predicted nuclease of predicted toxin-antitoxin system
MNVLLDENLPFRFIEVCERWGHTPFHIKKLGKGGIKNGEVYSLALELDACIFTRDADFTVLEKLHKYPVKGVVFFSISDSRTDVLVRYLNRFCSEYLHLLEDPSIIIISDDKIERIAPK